MTKAFIEVVLTMSLEEAAILAETLATFAEDHPSDAIHKTLEAALEAAEKALA